jgi:hypothetical protein
MRLSIGIVTWLALIGAAIFAAGPAAAKHQSHKVPKTEYMRAVPSGTPSGH